MVLPFFVTFQGGATSLCSTFLRIASVAFVGTTASLLAYFTRETHLLGYLSELLFDVIKGQIKSNDLGVLLVGVRPGAISNHVLMHLVHLEDDSHRIGDVFHDPGALEGIDKGKKLLSKRFLTAQKRFVMKRWLV
jgi:hypothetical protein